MSYTNAVEGVLADAGKNMQERLRDIIPEDNFYCRHVVREAWPKEEGCVHRIEVENDLPVEKQLGTQLRASELMANASYGVTEYTIRLQHAAVNSPDICLEDLRQDWHVNSVLDRVYGSFRESLGLIWRNTFRDAVIKFTSRHKVLRNLRALPEPDADEVMATPGLTQERRLNFFGKVVPAYLSGDGRTVANPKFKKAARQVVYFHPDTVHFLFPDLDSWTGQITWRNIPDAQCNPNGQIGFFRAAMHHAVRPVIPQYGRVFTVVPPGIKGFFWYLAWKLIRFNP